MSIIKLLWVVVCGHIAAGGIRWRGALGFFAVEVHSRYSIVRMNEKAEAGQSVTRLERGRASYPFFRVMVPAGVPMSASVRLTWAFHAALHSA